MSNSLAVAAVTATLQRQLDGALGDAASVFPNGVQGAKVFIGHPGASHPGATAGAELLLYRVTPDPNLRNADLETRDAAGQVVATPVAALALRYLIACFGDESNQEPEQVLGTIAAYLHAYPTLTPGMIAAARMSLQFPFLDDADLDGQARPVRLSQVPLEDEDLYRIWSMLPTDQLLPTLVFDATVVLLEQPVPLSVPYPVLARSSLVTPMATPRITGVARSGPPPAGPILAGDHVDVRGQLLVSGDWRLEIDGVAVLPAAIVSASDSLIAFTLPATTPAGLRRLEVVHVVGGGPAPATVFTASSGPTFFPVHPVLDSVAKVAGHVEVTVHVAIVTGQRVEVLLNRLGTNQSARLAGTVVAATTVRADPAGLPSAAYVVRVQVDGVSSVPTVGGSGVIDAPQVLL